MAQRVLDGSGRTGVGVLVKLSETNARMDFEKVEANKNKPEKPAVSFEIKVTHGENASIPDYIPFKKMKPNQKISIHATMDEAGTKILYAKPASGYFEVRFNKFVGEEGQAPVMTTKQGKNNKSYRTFACLFEITGGQWNNIAIQDGVWKGANYYYQMYDNFAPGVDNTLAVKGSGDGSTNLADFLDAVVAGGEQIQFSENPLPAIQELAHQLDSRFFVNVAKGWVVSLVVPFDEGVAEEEIGEFGESEEIPDALKEDGE